MTKSRLLSRPADQLQVHMVRTSMTDFDSQQAPPVPPVLDKMPVEIIEMICSRFHHPIKIIRWQFPIDEARKALFNLCRTSKRLHEIALSHLYRFVHISARETRLIPFTTSLLCNPHLGGFVRQIKIEKGGSFERNRVIESHLASQQADLLAGDKSRIDGKITGCGDWYTINTLDLLLNQLRNVVYLAMRIDDKDYREDCFTHIRDKHLDDKEFLHQLKEVIVYHEEGFKLAPTTALLSITPIQKLRLIHCHQFPTLNCFCLPSLLELKLYESYLEQTALIRLVKSCPNLQVFWCQRARYSMDWVYNGTYPQATCVGGGTGMSLAIRHLKKKLQSLSLYFHDRFHPYTASMTSFAEFSKLQYLTIETYALADRIEDSNWVANQDVDEDGLSPTTDYWGEDLEIFKDHTLALEPWVHKLPSSLQFLHINNAMKILEPGFSLLAERAKQDFPGLRVLAVDKNLGFHDLFRGTNIEYIERDHPRYHQLVRDIEFD